MLDIVKRFFSKTAPQTSKNVDQVSEHDVRVAACALFVEMARNADAPGHIMHLLSDINNLVDFDLADWHWKYHKELKDYPMTDETLKAVVPLTAEDYNAKFGTKDEPEEVEEDIHTELDYLRATAGVKVNTTAPKNDHTESLRIAAGIK